MINEDFHSIVERICLEDGRYKPDAYAFIMEALSYTQKKYKLTTHVSGPQLLRGVKDLLLEKYGPMAKTLLDHWGISKTDDFGHIVFHLVDNKVLTKTEEDRIDHFRNGYDFKEVFEQGYRKKLAQKISRMR